MTAPEYLVRQILRGDATVLALLPDEEDISPRGEQAPKGYPYAKYFKVSDNRGHGLNLVPLAWRQARVQIDLVAGSHRDVKALEDAVANRLQGFQGVVGADYVEACFVADARDDPENPAPNETGEFRVSLDVVITPRV